MTLRAPYLRRALLGVSLAAFGAGPVTAQVTLTRADSAVITAILREARDRSRVGDDVRYLSTSIGPRLSGTAGMRRASAWAASKLRSYGADSVWTESWPLGRVWQRGPIRLTLSEPYRQTLSGASWAWAPGTDGPVTGDVVIVDAGSADQFKSRFAGRIAGKWILLRPPDLVMPPERTLTAEDTAAADSARRARAAALTPEAVEFGRTLYPLLASEGVLGVIDDAAKPYGLLTMGGSPSALFPLPSVLASHESYSLLYRLASSRTRTRLEADINNTLTASSVEEVNTIGEIRGHGAPEEVVLIGAHLDSWDLADGAIDNATGVAAVMEALRLLRAAGARPQRTIRVVLFGGEEQGLLGSVRYAADHAAQLPRYQTVLVVDNGTGRIIGVPLNQREDLRPLWTSLVAPLAALGEIAVRSTVRGASDHVSFLPYGVPAFSFDQAPLGYPLLHHSQADTFEYVSVADLKQVAAAVAVFAYQLAQLDGLIARNK